MFVKEKPQICQKYYLTEVNIVELDTTDRHCTEMIQSFRWNFAEGTSKEMNYLNSHYIKALLLSTLKAIKKKEGTDILRFSPRKRDENASGF